MFGQTGWHQAGLTENGRGGGVVVTWDLGTYPNSHTSSTCPAPGEFAGIVARTGHSAGRLPGSAQLARQLAPLCLAVLVRGGLIENDLVGVSVIGAQRSGRSRLASLEPSESGQMWGLRMPGQGKAIVGL